MRELQQNATIFECHMVCTINTRYTSSMRVSARHGRKPIPTPITDSPCGIVPSFYPSRATSPQARRGTAFRAIAASQRRAPALVRQHKMSYCMNGNKAMVSESRERKGEVSRSKDGSACSKGEGTHVRVTKRCS